MIITTTSNIENYNIERYIGLVNASQVVGANFFSDLKASLSDFFGGTSGAYRGELEKLYEKITDVIKKDAESKGANAVIGYQIDFDEISGQNKSLFMVTAIGTAVVVSVDRYEVYKKLHELKVYLDDGLLTEEEYEREEKRIKASICNFIESESKELKRKEEEKICIQEQLRETIKRKEEEENNKMVVLSVEKSSVKKLNDFVVGEIIEIVDSEEYVCIDCFTQDGRILCKMNNEYKLFSFEEVAKVNIE